jgi:putative Mn2+ efflux pump MntP
MNFFTIVIIAFGMSADAFAAALGKGSTLDRPRLIEAIRTGLVFGLVEAVTPVIGWAAGPAASGYIGTLCGVCARRSATVVRLKLVATRKRACTV